MGNRGKRECIKALGPMEVCKSLDLIPRSMSDFAIHLTAGIIGEAESVKDASLFCKCGIPDLPTMLAPAKPVLRILDRIDPLAKLAAMR
jgi:hypothetical protein